ncbi:MAG: hypothetical protein D4S00_05560 [Streptomycetaceae bacterium]|nr:MAG: hypothetical protein D4S00_05560 [Streptomycetaceae bacterium]
MSHGNELLEKLTDTTTLINNIESRPRLHVLLTDFIVAARAGKISHRKPTNQVNNLGSQLAINSSYLDVDDIDWSFMTHPGSIIWAALLESLILNPKNASRFCTAAKAGYRTSASVANFFGASHRKNWHVTTTAGALAAATVSSVFRNLPAEQHLTALRSSASNMGGIAIADRRTGAAVFNRASATSLGLLATDYAASGLSSAVEIWDGERGLLQLFSIQDWNPVLQDGVSTSSLRLFPYNGFIQSLVYAITQLAQRCKGELVEIHLGVNAITYNLVNGSVGGNYWDLRHGAASAWQSKDLGHCVEASPEVLTRISVAVVDVPVAGAEVSVKTTLGIDSIRLEVAPGSNFGEIQHDEWQVVKWERLIGKDLQLAQKFSLALISDDINVKEITRLREFLF